VAPSAPATHARPRNIGAIIAISAFVALGEAQKGRGSRRKRE